MTAPEEDSMRRGSRRAAGARDRRFAAGASAGRDRAGPTTRYARLYVFGDSYSDIGAGYIDGNGPTAVAYLGWLMGLQVAPSKAADAGGQEPRVRRERRGDR